MSDYKGAALMLDALPKANVLLGDRGYDADWFRHALTTRGITPCIPSKANRKIAIPHDRVLYRQRHRVENTRHATINYRARDTNAWTDNNASRSFPHHVDLRFDEAVDIASLYASFDTKL